VSARKKNTIANATMMKTITVVMIVSRRVGQVTFEVSARTCWRNSSGLVFAISLLKCPLRHPARWSHFPFFWPGTAPRLAIRRLGQWQEWRGSNPQPPVLETGALPVELHSQRLPPKRQPRTSYYFHTLDTTPAPTVRPRSE